MIKIKSLHIYPIKSLGGISLDASNVTFRGLAYDRRWLLIDENNQFVSQRTFAKMAMLQPELNEGHMCITDRTGKNSMLKFDLSEPSSTAEMVTVWDDTMPAKEVSQEASNWFSRALEMPLRLMYMHEESIRQADQRYAVNESDHVSFADGYPVLITSEASMDQLNAKTSLEQSVDRFRANIILSGIGPHEEDTLRQIRIGRQELFGVKPCARCVMTTIDPSTAEAGKEPLKTLATYRKVGNKILFGENFIPTNESHIRVGDKVAVVERKDALL